MRQRVLAISILALFVVVLAACNSTGLPDAANATPPQPTATTLATNPTATTKVNDPTATAPDVSQEATETPEAVPVTPQASGTADAEANNKMLLQIEKDAATFRGLQPLKDVPETFITEDQLRQNLTKDMAENYSEKEARRDASELWLLRLLDDPTIDLYKLEIDMETEQVAGYYDQKKDELFVRSDGGLLSPLARQTLAHEFTHALQDQHYDLEKLLPEKSTDDDRGIAVRSLVEGDATISGLLYARKYMSEKDYNAMIEESKNASTTVVDKAPRYIRENLFFPYDQGVQFVIALGIMNGYKPINKALQDPPVSSEQIMHPEKYIDNPRDLPKPVALPPLTDTLGTEWTMTDNGTLGEFDLQIMLQENNASEADSAAAGWGGGVFSYYENGNKALVMMNTVWDTPKDADEFDAGIKETLASSKKDGEFWTDSKRFFSVKRVGGAITVGASTDLAALVKAMGAVK